MSIDPARGDFYCSRFACTINVRACLKRQKSEDVCSSKCSQGGAVVAAIYAVATNPELALRLVKSTNRIDAALAIEDAVLREEVG